MTENQGKFRHPLATACFHTCLLHSFRFSAPLYYLAFCSAAPLPPRHVSSSTPPLAKSLVIPRIAAVVYHASVQVWLACFSRPDFFTSHDIRTIIGNYLILTLACRKSTPRYSGSCRPCGASANDSRNGLIRFVAAYHDQMCGVIGAMAGYIESFSDGTTAPGRSLKFDSSLVKRAITDLDPWSPIEALVSEPRSPHDAIGKLTQDMP